VALKERENKGIGSPVSGNAVRASHNTSRLQNLDLPMDSELGGISGISFPGIKSPD